MGVRKRAGRDTAITGSEASSIGKYFKYGKLQIKIKSIVAVAAVALVVVAVVSLILVRHHITPSKPGQTGSSPSGKPISKAEQAFNAASASARQLDTNGQYTEEAKSLETYLSTSPDQAYAVQASIQLGSAYLNAKDYSNAVVWYQKTLDMSTTPSQKMAAIHGLALSYKWSGNNAAAIDQYKAAIAIAKTMPNDDQAVRIVKVDTTAITQLGGTP